jgi:hypothetical protein
MEGISDVMSTFVERDGLLKGNNFTACELLSFTHSWNCDDKCNRQIIVDVNIK